jgi:two-component system response regulator YesN
LAGDYYIVLAVEADIHTEEAGNDQQVEDELLLLAVHNICDELCNKFGGSVVFQSNNERVVAILSGEDREELLGNSMSLSEDIRQKVEKYLWSTVTIGVGKICSDLKEISDSYKSAVSALDYRLLIGKNHVINICDMENSIHKHSFEKREYEKKLISFIKTGAPEAIGETVSTIINSLKGCYPQIQRYYIHIQQILVSIIDVLNELGYDEEEVFGERNLLGEIYSYQTLSEIEQWLKEVCRIATVFIRDKRTDFYQVQALKAQQYIDENFSKENISLNSVCKYLLISPSYFSLIFKKETGCTFVEILTKVRIEKAKELLAATSLKTYEIAEKVGYNDPHYFSAIFKKVTGLTPTEYRDKV